MNELETITGTIERFIYQSHDNSFAVFRVQAQNSSYAGSQAITAKGSVPSVTVGQEVELKGSWVYHSKFGKQFNVSSCIQVLPTSSVGLKKYLGSGLIKGIGPAYAEKLVNYFKTDVLEIIDKHPEKLLEVEGIGQKRVNVITQAWKEQKHIAQIMVFLQEKNISTAFSVKIYKKYKHESLAVLKDNPYRIADEIWGVGFKTADEIAQKMGFAKNDIKRISAGILYVISLASQSGHLYKELNELKKDTIKILELTPAETEYIDSADAPNPEKLIKNALHTLYNTNKIKFIGYENSVYITLTSFYHTERNTCKSIRKLLKRTSKFDFNIDNIYQSLRTSDKSSIELNEDQQKGILSSLQNKISIITGGPGTGKTTLIRKLLEILEFYNVSYKLAAPTGRAAKRMMEGTGRFAQTIHRLLEFDPATNRFVYNESNALKLDFLIIDEASMIDIFLSYSILKALPEHAHVIFIGDIDQLPSVGPGNFLNDLINSKQVACTRLKHIFRQAQNSLITINAHRINQGEFPVNYLPEARKDCRFIKEEQPENIEDHLKKILFVELRKRNISIDDAIILTPMNRGPVGTQALNQLLQRLLNSYAGPEKVQVHGVTYKVGDKVMQIRNNYTKKVYNGDIGKISSIDITEKQVYVDFDHTRASYEFDELNEIVLAYAISIHKSQGSEYSAVIVPVFMQHFMLLQRNLMYTAITRAKKNFIFIGQPKALIMAVKNTKNSIRITFLDKLLNKEIE